MKEFLSIDLETTGLDEEYCQILEFGAVLGDFSDTPVDSLPSLNLRFRYEQVRGEPYALMMNAGLIRDMALGIGKWVAITELVCQFEAWLKPARSLTITGKNFGSFDRRFLAKVRGFNLNRFSHRILDVGSLYFNPAADQSLPNLATCAVRAGIDTGRFDLHTAVGDARLVVEIVRRFYRRGN